MEAHAAAHPHDTCIGWVLSDNECIPVAHHEMLGASAAFASAMVKRYASKKGVTVESTYVVPAPNAIGVNVETNITVKCLATLSGGVATVKSIKRPTTPSQTPSTKYDLEDHLCVCGAF